MEEAGRTQAHSQKSNQAAEVSGYFHANAMTARHESFDHEVRRKPPERQLKQPSPNRSTKDRGQSKPPVGLPDKPFLGFGCKGAPPISKSEHNAKSSYYTWSESVRHRSSPPRADELARFGPSRSHAQQDLRQHSHKTIAKNESRDARDGTTRQSRPIDQERSHGRRVQTQRGLGPALVEIYKPPNHIDRRRKENTPVLPTTSQSLPRHPSSPPISASGQQKYDAARSREPKSYHTSDILKINAARMQPSRTSLNREPHAIDPDYDKENHNPASSLSIDKAMRRAGEAAKISHVANRQDKQKWKDVLDHQALPNIRRLASINELQPTHQLRKAPLESKTVHALQQRGSIYPELFRRPSPLFSRPFSMATQRRFGGTADGMSSPQLPDVDRLHSSEIIDEADEMLDNAADHGLVHSFDHGIYMEDWQQENIPSGEQFAPRPSIFQGRPKSSVLSMRSWAHEHAAIGRGSTQGISIEHDLAGGRPLTRGDDLNDSELAGFWKPNRLY